MATFSIILLQNPFFHKRGNWAVLYPPFLVQGHYSIPHNTPGTPILGHVERFILDRQSHDAFEGANSWTIFTEPRTMVESDHVPSLSEKPHTKAAVLGQIPHPSKDYNRLSIFLDTPSSHRWWSTDTLAPRAHTPAICGLGYSSCSLTHCLQKRCWDLAFKRFRI